MLYDWDVMIEITSIYAKDAEAAYREFFQKDFTSLRLGSKGTWFGAGAEFLNLKNPVRQAAFEHLLNGQSPNSSQTLRSESHNGHAEVAWRIDVSAPKSLSILWALAPAGPRIQIEAAHNDAVRSALKGFELAMGSSVPPWEETPLPIFASFRSRADKNQTPDLHATVLLPKRGHHAGWSAGEIHHAANHGEDFLARCV